MNEKSRILWRCRRGIREMDILFTGFMENCYDELSDEDKLDFESFLNELDLDILNWVMGKSKPNNERYNSFVNSMKKINTNS